MNIKALIFSLFCVILACETPESPEVVPDIIPETPLNLTGVTWAHINANDTENIFIDSIIVSYDEILEYDSAVHTYSIDQIAGERIRSILYPTTGSRFAITVDSVIIYTALFFQHTHPGLHLMKFVWSRIQVITNTDLNWLILLLISIREKIQEMTLE